MKIQLWLTSLLSMNGFANLKIRHVPFLERGGFWGFGDEASWGT